MINIARDAGFSVPFQSAISPSLGISACELRQRILLEVASETIGEYKLDCRFEDWLLQLDRSSSAETSSGSTAYRSGFEISAGTVEG